MTSYYVWVMVAKTAVINRSRIRFQIDFAILDVNFKGLFLIRP